MFKKVVLAASLLIISLPYFGQEEEKKAQYGFTLGVNRSSLEHNIQNTISEKEGAGFRLGILAEYHLLKGLYFSPRAELSFINNSLEYLEPNLFQRNYQIIPVGLDGKVNLMYKFLESKNLSPFVLGGASYLLALEGEKESLEYGSGSTFTLDVGVGVERKFDAFTFAPEFRYSHGLTNVNENPRFKGDIYLHNFTVALVFKG